MFNTYDGSKLPDGKIRAAAVFHFHPSAPTCLKKFRKKHTLSGSSLFQTSFMMLQCLIGLQVHPRLSSI
jgi:hypothetical protein